jgi:hypothetical protein
VSVQRRFLMLDELTPLLTSAEAEAVLGLVRDLAAMPIFWSAHEPLPFTINSKVAKTC